MRHLGAAAPITQIGHCFGRALRACVRHEGYVDVRRRLGSGHTLNAQKMAAATVAQRGLKTGLFRQRKELARIALTILPEKVVPRFRVAETVYAHRLAKMFLLASIVRRNPALLGKLKNCTITNTLVSRGTS